MPTDAELQSMVRSECLSLAEILDDWASAWDVPSLCEGWRVREVVAHMTMPVRYDQAAFMDELRRDDFDFPRLSNRIAARDATLATSELLAGLRAPALHEWVPPDGGPGGALTHAVIHGLDIRVPLRTPRRPGEPSVLAVLDLLTAGGAAAYFGTTLEGQRFVATDADWSFGAGTEVRAPAELLVLHMSGRRVLAG